MINSRVNNVWRELALMRGEGSNSYGSRKSQTRLLVSYRYRRQYTEVRHKLGTKSKRRLIGLLEVIDFKGWRRGDSNAGPSTAVSQKSPISEEWDDEDNAQKVKAHDRKVVLRSPSVTIKPFDCVMTTGGLISEQSASCW